MDTVECPIGHIMVHDNKACPYCEIAQLRQELRHVGEQLQAAYEAHKVERKRADGLQEELNDARSLLNNLGMRHDAEKKRADELQKEMENLNDSYRKLVHFSDAESKRADLNERALELACRKLNHRGWSETPDYFRKLAQESK